MKKTYSTILLLLVFSIFINSCREKLQKPQWDVDILIPIAKTTISLRNLIGDTLVQTNPDNSLSIVYQDTIFTLSLDTLANIPDTTIKQTLVIPVIAQIPPGVEIFNFNEELKFNFNGPELTRMIIRSGFVGIKLISDIPEDVVLKYTMPGATKYGVPFESTVTIPASSSVTQSNDFSNYTIDLTGKNGNDFNTIVLNVIPSISPTGDTTAVSPLNKIIVENNFINLITEYAKGYFGQYNFKEDSITNLDLFNSLTAGSFDLESINISLKIINGFGIDGQAVINNLTSVNNSTGNSVLLSHPVVGSFININRATESPSSSPPFVNSVYNITFDKNNSNTDVLLENLPDQFSYSFDFFINPLGNISNGNDFMYYESSLEVYLDLEIPTSFIINNLTMADSIDISMDPNSNINYGTFTLLVDNGFPYEMTTQLYLFNKSGNLIDSLLTPGTNIVDAAPVDANYKVTNKKLTKLIMWINTNKMSRIMDATKGYISFSLLTKPENQFLKIYSGYTLDVKLVGDFNYTVNGN